MNEKPHYGGIIAASSSRGKLFHLSAHAAVLATDPVTYSGLRNRQSFVTNNDNSRRKSPAIVARS